MRYATRSGVPFFGVKPPLFSNTHSKCTSGLNIKLDLIWRLENLMLHYSLNTLKTLIIGLKFAMMPVAVDTRTKCLAII